MSKGPRITDKVKAVIAEVYLEHPDWFAKEIQTEVNKRLKTTGWPGLSAVQKVITDIRKRGKGLLPDPKDKPFCLGALVNNPIPPEALPIVMRVWAKRVDETKKDKKGFSFQMTFTIRDALWVSRLSRLYDDPEALWGAALWYSVRERAYEAIGEAIDTTDLDTEVLRLLKLEEDEQKEGKPTPTERKRKRKGGTK